MIIVNVPKKTNTEIQLLTNKLKDKNLLISLKPDSIFHHVEKASGEFYNDTNTLGKMFAEKIAPVLDLYKNKFIPLAHDMEAKLLEAKSNYTPESKFSRYDIIPVYLPGVLDVFAKKGYISNETSQLDYNAAVTNVYTKNLDTENVNEIIPLLYTGNYEVDEMLKVFLGKFTYKEIITIWNDHVANFTTEGVRHVLAYKEYNVDELTMIFIMLDALYNGRITYEGNNESKYSLDKYYHLVKAALGNINFLFKRAISLNTLVLNIKEDDKSVCLYVNGVVYDNLLKETNNSDLIIGLHMYINSGVPNDNIPSLLTATLEQVLENKVNIENTIKREASLEKLNSIQNEDKLYNNLYLTSSKLIAECIPNDLKDLLVHDEQRVKEIINSIISTFSLEAKRDVFLTCCYIIEELYVVNNKEECFKFNFHKFISRASEFDRLINTDMKEAVNLVVYEFIIDVLLQEIDIVKTTEVLNGSKKVY